MGKRYVMINELKPEHVQDYIDMHMNCPSSELYKGQLDALKEAGAEECIVYMWKNYSILIVKTDDIDAYMKKLGETHANQIWEEKALVRKRNQIRRFLRDGIPAEGIRHEADGRGRFQPVLKEVRYGIIKCKNIS